LILDVTFNNVSFPSIASASMEVDGMEDELTRTKDEYQLQRDLLDSTASRLQDTEEKLRQVNSVVTQILIV
jgi:hypothetical protein